MAHASIRRIVVSLSVVVVWTSLVCFPSTSAPAAGQGRATEYVPAMVILDASGSMQGPDSAGGTKLAAAKAAVHSFVEAAPPESKLGLAAYGTSTGSSDREKEAGCADVEVLRPLDTVDKPALNAAVDSVQATGYTPIGRALQVAADSLPDAGPRSIVLVSDGEDTCAPPDPCTVAAELDSRGVDVVVHTIGFGVDEASRAQLTCIAQRTGGTYSDAVDGPALRRILPRVGHAALRSYRALGAPVTGTSDYSDAPVVQPGQYLDDLGRQETKYYAVDVPPGATVYFTATLSLPQPRDSPSETDSNNNDLELAVHGYDGQSCDTTHGFVLGLSGNSVLTAGHVWNGATDDENNLNLGSCRGGGRYYFAPQWQRAGAGMPERVPMELSIRIEPEVLDPGPHRRPSLRHGTSRAVARFR